MLSATGRHVRAFSKLLILIIIFPENTIFSYFRLLLKPTIFTINIYCDETCSELWENEDLHKAFFQREKKRSFYSYSNDRIGNDEANIFSSSLIPLVKSYLKILIFHCYPNKLLIILTKCM